MQTTSKCSGVVILHFVFLAMCSELILAGDPVETSALLKELQSPDRATRILAARELEGHEIAPDAAPNVMKFIESEISSIGKKETVLDLKIHEFKQQSFDSSLTRIKADPRRFVGRSFTIVGVVSMSEYYNFKYDNAETSHYSLNLDEINSKGEYSGESAHLYLARGIASEFLVERIVEAEENEKDGVFLRARVAIDPARYDGAVTWDQMEVLNWQLFGHEGLYLGLSLLVKLNDADSLVGLVTKREAYGERTFDAYFRLIVTVYVSELDKAARNKALVMLRREASRAKKDKNEYIEEWAIGAAAMVKLQQKFRPYSN